MPRALTTAKFIERAAAKYGDTFDYSATAYSMLERPIIVRCRLHGEFSIAPDKHMQALCGGCRACAEAVSKTARLTTARFIERACRVHSERYCYDQVEYIDSATKVIITCPQHGPFLMSPNKHLTGQGCKRCGHIRLSERRRSKMWKLIQRISEVHGLGTYDYDLRGYMNFHSRVRIRCHRHGWFEQEVGAHLSGHSCSKCCCSRGERRVRKTLRAMDIDFCEQARFPECRDRGMLAFDFYIPSRRTLVEYDGKQHYKKSELWGGHHVLVQTQRHDAIKDRFAATHGYLLIRIPYWEFERIESILRERLVEQQKVAAA